MNTSTLTPTVRALIAINVIVFLVQSINKLYDLQIVSLFGLHYFTSERFMPFQLVTYMFVHGGFSHIFGNMIWLFFIGSTLENLWGQKRFLIFYIVTGIGGALLYMLLKYYDFSQLQLATQTYINHPNLLGFSDFLGKYYTSGLPKEALIGIEDSNNISIKDSVLIAESGLRAVINTPLIGASGAIFGIQTAFGMLFPNTEINLMFIPIPIKVKYFISVVILLEGYMVQHKMPGDNVAHFAHIGGVIVAFILIKLWQKQRNNFY
jgi:membrane associated rhomboid family serine protease